MRTTTTKTTIGDEVGLTAVSEWDGVKRMDTKITLSSGLLCWVSGEEYPTFITLLEELVNKYRI